MNRWPANSNADTEPVPTNTTLNQGNSDVQRGVGAGEGQVEAA